MSRRKGETILTAFEAAAIIRAAFGREGGTSAERSEAEAPAHRLCGAETRACRRQRRGAGKVKARNGFTAATLVAALWVAQNDSGKERLGDLIRWARRMV